MKVLVCGGRDFSNRKRVYEVLDAFAERQGIGLIINGAAHGADYLSTEWAKARGVLSVEYPALWDLLGLRAGMARNLQMLQGSKPDIVIAFPGGKGTAGMKHIARQAGVTVVEVS